MNEPGRAARDTASKAAIVTDDSSASANTLIASRSSTGIGIATSNRRHAATETVATAPVNTARTLKSCGVYRRVRTGSVTAVMA
jgi:hypothetical protein